MSNLTAGAAYANPSNKTDSPLDTGFVTLKGEHDRIHQLLHQLETKLLITAPPAPTSIANEASAGPPGYATELRNRLERAGRDAGEISARLSSMIERI
ncbi:MAG: hypothetical protein ACREP7_15020 [Lysobacter sp.]